jgi:dTDP-4-dehydrorhamnose reductase
MTLTGGRGTLNMVLIQVFHSMASKALQCAFCSPARPGGSAVSLPPDCAQLATPLLAWTLCPELKPMSSVRVSERAVVERAFANHGIEAVVHAGALHKPDIARYPGSAFIDANVSGTLNLLEGAVAAGHDRFTSVTSLMISRDIRQETASAALWLDESLGPLAPRSFAASIFSNMG